MPVWEDFNNAVAKAQRQALVKPPAGVPIMVGVWDMDENHWGDSPQQTDNLPWEVNLIPVGNVSEAFFADWDLTFSPYSGFDVGPLLATYPMGWFFIDFQPTYGFIRGTTIYPGTKFGYKL